MNIPQDYGLPNKRKVSETSILNKEKYFRLMRQQQFIFKYKFKHFQQLLVKTALPYLCMYVCALFVNFQS